MKIFKFLILTISIMVVSITFIACGYTEEEKQAMKAYEKRGKEIAENYIKNKYGFEGKIKDISIEKAEYSILNFYPDPTGRVFVEMEHDGRRFKVYADAEGDDNQCYDNYQMVEIEKAVVSRISECVENQPWSYNLYYGVVINEHKNINGLIEEYFDGNNLDDILNDDKVDVNGVFEFIGDNDFKNINDLKLSHKGKKRLLFVNYRNTEDTKKVITHTYNILGTPQDMEIYKNAVYIKNAALIENNSVKDFPIDIKESNGIYYFKPENNETLYISTEEAEDISNWYGRGVIESKGKTITPAYNIQFKDNKQSDNNGGRGNLIYIFYPAEKLDKNKDYVAGVKYYNSNGEEEFNTTIGQFIGDYYEFTIAKDRINESFTIIEEEK